MKNKTKTDLDPIALAFGQIVALFLMALFASPFVWALRHVYTWALGF